jgi:hypothetical protein
VLTGKGRLVGEFVLIVVGVLLALAADRWNQERLDRVAAAEYGERILSELVADSLRLDAARRYHADRISGGVALLAAVSPSSDPDTLPSEVYFRAAGNAPLPYAGGTTFRELESSGALGLITSEARQALFDYYGWVDATLGRLQDTRSYSREPLIQAANRSGFWTPPRDRAVTSASWRRLRAYPEVADLVTALIAYHSVTADQLDDWTDRLSQLLSTLRSHQDR